MQMVTNAYWGGGIKSTHDLVLFTKAAITAICLKNALILLQILVVWLVHVEVFVLLFMLTGKGVSHTIE